MTLTELPPTKGGRPELTLAHFGYSPLKRGLPLPVELLLLYARTRYAEVEKYGDALRWTLASGGVLVDRHEPLELVVHGLKLAAVCASPDFESALSALQQKTSCSHLLIGEGGSRAQFVAGLASDIKAVLAECDKYLAELQRIAHVELAAAMANATGQAPVQETVPRALALSSFQAGGQDLPITDSTLIERAREMHKGLGFSVWSLRMRLRRPIEENAFDYDALVEAAFNAWCCTDVAPSIVAPATALLGALFTLRGRRRAATSAELTPLSAALLAECERLVAELDLILPAPSP